ncbi:hypothetical protein JQC92_08235 [Shewanella sp. 202IG2-18]|nr:hypothetical protein [Parashewanella hymeniacidonis]
MLFNGIIKLKHKKVMGTKIHDAAKPAYEFYHKQRHLFDKSSHLFIESREIISASQPICVIEPEDGDFRIISGFANVFFDCCREDYSKFNVLRSPKSLTDDEVSTIAWKHVISTSLNSISQHGLHKWQTLIKKSCPADLRKQIFGASQISQSLVAELTGFSRGGIAKQFNSEKVKQKDNNLPDIAHELAAALRHRNQEEL